MMNMTQKIEVKVLTLELPESQKLPENIQRLLQGINIGFPNEFDQIMDEKPEWLDLEKFKKGQIVARKYIFCISFAQLVSLILLYAVPTSLEPLIFTGKSSTPFTSFRRYLSTLRMTHSWYDHDMWDRSTLGHRNLRIARTLHLKVNKDSSSTSENELKSRVTVQGKSDDSPVWSTVKSTIKEDFKGEFRVNIKKLIEQETTENIHINQLMMSLTQFGMMGLLIMYPEKFGAGKATKEELSAFVYTWRCLGHLLGIEERFNFCAGTLEEVIQRCHHTMDYLIKPSLHIVTEDWEHMMRCMVTGASYIIPILSFEVCLAYLYWLMDMPTSKQTALLSWSQTCVFYFLKFNVCCLLRLPGMLSLQNWVLRKAMDRAANLSPQQLHHLENLRNDYYIPNMNRFTTI